jgi:hypothetical protein
MKKAAATWPLRVVGGGFANLFDAPALERSSLCMNLFVRSDHLAIGIRVQAQIVHCSTNANFSPQ